MRMGGVRSLLPMALLLVPAGLPAQSAPEEGNANVFANFGDDLHQEKVNLGSCKKFGLPGITGCAETLFTGTPFHIAVSSLAPQNGVAAGVALSEMVHPTYCSPWLNFSARTSAATPGSPSRGASSSTSSSMGRSACLWSLNLNAEGAAASNGSWRAGFYATAVRINSARPAPHFPGQPRARHAPVSFTGASATVGFYSETTSLNRVYFFGVGANTAASARTDFGFTENVTGINAVVPLRPWWLDAAGIALVGEFNGRFPSVRGSSGDTSPSIDTVYGNAAAPGLSTQPGYLQAGEGLRLVPSLPLAQLQLNYLLNFQQFVAPANSRYSFRRLTADLDHQLVLYTKDVGKPAAPRPPLPDQPHVPPISPTRDVTGSLDARLLIQESIANAGSTVPFYFMPTIGGSDVDGQAILPSYPDYRFRAPNLLLIHGSYEQSLGKIPIGLFVGVDEAKVALRRDDIAFDHLRHSYSAGFTVHAGGLPVLYLVFAWGGPEGHHTIVNISNALLGSTPRPTLF